MFYNITQKFLILHNSRWCIWICNDNTTVFLIIICCHKIKIIIQRRSFKRNIKKCSPDIIKRICYIREKYRLLAVKKRHKRYCKYIIRANPDKHLIIFDIVSFSNCFNKKCRIRVRIKSECIKVKSLKHFLDFR